MTMSDSALSKDAQQILNIIKQSNKRLKISQIESLLPHAISRRTLQRRLQELKENGKIALQGIKSGAGYFLSETQMALPLSKAAQRLKLQIAQPLVKRKPVAYKPDFLFSYKPNKTFYLSEKMRGRLSQLGRQFNHELEPGVYVKRILHRLLIDLSWNSSRLE